MYTMEHYILNERVSPVEWEKIGFKGDFTQNLNELQLTVDELTFTNKAKTIIDNHVDQYGLHVGIPYTVKLGSISEEFFLSLSENPEFQTHQVTLKVFKRKGLNWFMRRANSLTFESLNQKQPVTGAFDHPYVIVKDTQALELLMLALSGFTITQSIIQSVKDIAASIASTVQASTPNAGIPPSIDLGDIIALVIKVAAQVVYLIALIIALVKLIAQIMEIIFPKLRYLNAISLKNLITQGVQYLGFNLSSTLLDEISNASVIPVPLQDTNKSIFEILLSLQSSYYNKGYPSALDTIPTLGSAIQKVMDDWNGELRQIGNTIYLERDEFWQNNASVDIRLTLNIQETRVNKWTYNTAESWKRKRISHLTDPADTHTLDNIKGLDAEDQTEVLASPYPDLEDVDGEVTIISGFALASRKNKLTYIEKQVAKLAQGYDNFINSVGGNSNAYAKVQGRIGSTQISSQYFTKTKLIWAVGGKQPADYLSHIGARAISDSHHVTKRVKENFKRVESAVIPFSPHKFFATVGNNYVFNQYGQLLKVLRFEFINESRDATIEYALFEPEKAKTKTIKIYGD